MKLSILVLTAVFFLFPLTAVAGPDQQPDSFTENLAQLSDKAGPGPSVFAEESAIESLSAQLYEEIYEMEIERTNEDILEEVKETIAEDILINN